jgi:hypothetical protein
VLDKRHRPGLGRRLPVQRPALSLPHPPHHGVLHIAVLRAARQAWQQDEYGCILRQVLQKQGRQDGKNWLWNC